MIDILSTSGELLLEVPILEDAVSHEELMGQDYVQLSWSSSTGDVLPAGTYIIHNNEKYFLLEPYTPAVVSEVEYKYRPQFHSSVDTWDKHPACVYAYSEDGSVASKQFDWTFTGAPSDAMHIVVQAIAEETGESWTARIADSLPATIELTCQANSIRSILSSIADQCETEYWVDKPSKTLYLSRCSKGEALSLRIGKDIGVPSITTPKEGYYTRYYALGSTRNIPQGSNNSSYIANQRLTLSPTVYPYGYKDVKGHFSGGQFVSDLKPNEIFSKVVIFDDIYPSSKLKITNVRPRLKYRLMDGGEKVVIGGTEEEPIYDQYAVWYFQIENFEFKEETVIKGQELSVHFNSGQLAGRDFSLAYHAEAKEVFTDGDVAKFQIEAGDYEILFVEEGGMVIPSLTYIVPVEGDSVTLFNINMPTEYINAAMSDLEDAVNKKIAEEEGDHNTYEFDSFPTAFHKKKIDVALGRVVSIVDADGKKSTSTRVTMVEKHLDCGSVQRIRCSKKVAKSNTVQVKESLTSVNNNLDVIKAFNEMSEAIYESYARTQAKINEALLRISDMFFWMDEDKTTIGTKFNFVSEKQIAAGGVIGSGDEDGGGDGEGDGTGEGFLLLNSWPASGDYSSYALGANLGIELNERLKRIEDGEITPDLTGYATQDWVLERGYLTSADLSGYALKSDVDALKEFFDGVEDQDALINKWHELEDFLAGVEEGDTLLAMVANNDTQINVLTQWITALDKDVTAMKGLVDGFDTRITYFEDMFEWVLDESGNRIAIRAKSNFFSELQVAAGGIGESIGLGSGGGITGIVVNGEIYNEPDEMGMLTLPNYPTSLLWSNIEDKPSFAAVATSGSYNDLTDKPAIPSLSGYATQQWVLSQGFAVASSLGGLAYKDGISWSEVSGRPTKLSDFTDDILSGKYLPIGGNAASATKLADNTAFTAWGQTFFENGKPKNVTGTLKTPSGYNAVSILDSYLVLGQGMAENSKPTYLDGYNVYMRYGNSSTIGFTLNNSGNVGIGATSPTYKLDVFSNNFSCLRLARNNGEGYGAVILSENNVNTLGIFGWNQEDDFLINAGGINTVTGNILFRASSNGIQLNAATKINGSALIYKGSSNYAFTHITNEYATIDYSHIFVSNEDKSRADRPLILQNGYGNVGIGTPNPAYKLHVNGIAGASGLIGNNVCIACGSDGTTSGYSGEINRFGGGNLYIQGREGGLMLGFDGNTTTVRGMLVVNRDVTIGNSTSGTLKIGGATLSWDDANKALKIDTGFYSLGQIAAGGIGTESEGSGSGTIGLLFDSTKTWAEYTSDMADYALAAYHGKALNDRLVAVEAKAGDYLPITGGTMNGSILFGGRYSIGTSTGRVEGVYAIEADISGSLKATNINVGSITGLTVISSSFKSQGIEPLIGNTFYLGSDSSRWKYVYANNINTVDTVTEYVTAAADDLYLKGSIVLMDDGSNEYGYLYSNGVNFLTDVTVNGASVATQTWADGRYVKINGSSVMTGGTGLKWDSGGGGNSDNFASALFVGADTSTSSSLATSKRQWTAVLNVGGIDNMRGYRFQLASYVGPTDNQLYYRGYNNNGSEWKPWKIIAFTDSNVASATKLATARTIWGQSFDGTGNVSGSIYGGHSVFAIYGYDDNGNTNIIDCNGANKKLWIGYGSASKSYSTELAGYNMYFRYGTGRTTGLILNSSGNVTIGSSDLAGTDYKFVVNGLSRFKNNVESDGNVIGAGAVQAKTSAHGFVSLQVGSTGNKGLLDSRTSWIIYTNGTNTFLPQGNVGIGTTSPAYKLDVNGEARIGALRSAAKDFIIYGWDGTNFVNAIDVDCNNSNLWIGYGSAPRSYGTNIAGNNIYFFYGTSRAAGLSLLSSGNLDVHVQANFGATVKVASQLIFGTNSDTGGYFASGSDGTYWGAYTHSKGTWKATNAYFYPDGSVRFPNNVDIGVAFNGTPSSGKLKIGSAVLSWDSTNNALKIEGNVYATGQVASGGIGAEGDNIATYNKWGGLKPAYSTTGKATLTTTSAAFTNSPTIAARTTTAGRYYAVEMDAAGRAFVNVPWVNTNYWTLDSSVSRIYPADTARQLCVGGTGSSAYSTSLYKLVVHGSAFAISGTWQSSSDMTMKDVVKDIDLDIKDIANAPSFAFTWKGSEDKTEWLGTSAQYWKTILPTAVKGEEGSYSLSYGELALTTAIAIAKKTMNHEDRIKELELQVKTLKDRLSVYEN